MHLGVFAKYGQAKLPVFKIALMAVVALVFAFALVSLSGCKYSDVLLQHIENPELGTLDENAEPEYVANPNSDVILDLAELSLDDSDTINTQVETLPHYDPNAPDNGPTPQRLKSEETPHDEEATEANDPEDVGNREGEGEGEDESGEGEGEGTKGNDDSSENPDNPGENEQPNSEEDPDNSAESNESLEDDSESGGGGDVALTDPEDGTNEEVLKGTVAAVGEYATIAQMVGGAGSLVACDESWLSAREADGCFGGELDKVTVAFSGDGTEEGCCNVDVLIDTVKPSVILYDGHNPALTDSDRERLEAAGITIQPVPTIGKQTTEDYAITQAVLQVGGILEEVSPNAPSVASSYVTAHDNVLKAAYDNNKDTDNNGSHFSFKSNDLNYEELYQETPLAGLNASTTARVSTAYIDDWVGLSIRKATVSQHSEAFEDGSSIELAHDGEAVDVSDGVGVSASSDSGDYMLIDYYLQLAGVVNNAYDTDAPSPSGLAYPVIPGESTDVENALKGHTTTRRMGSALFYSAGISSVKTNWVAVGGSDGLHDPAFFPGVLVRDADIMGSIEASAAKDNGLYHMDNSYRVIVVPSGIAGPWSEGHIDSFLLSLWAYNLRGGEANLSSVSDVAKDFYQSFMRCGEWRSDGEGDTVVTNWNNSIETEAG